MAIPAREAEAVAAASLCGAGWGIRSREAAANDSAVYRLTLLLHSITVRSRKTLENLRVTTLGKELEYWPPLYCTHDGLNQVTF